MTLLKLAQGYPINLTINSMVDSTGTKRAPNTEPLQPNSNMCIEHLKQVVRVNCPHWEDGELVYEKLIGHDHVTIYWERWKDDDVIRTRLQDVDFPYPVNSNRELREMLVKYRFSILKYQTNKYLYPELRFKRTVTK